MARQVIVKTWCDPCLAQEQETEAVELPPLKLPELPGRARVLALCEVHRKELYEPLVEVLRELGQTVDAEGRPAGARGPARKSLEEPVEASSASSSTEVGPTTCPSCFKELKSLGSLQAHTRHVHNVTLRELQGHRQGDGFTCPECGQVCLNAQGLGAHRSRKHGIKGQQAKAPAKAS